MVPTVALASGGVGKLGRIRPKQIIWTPNYIKTIQANDKEVLTPRLGRYMDFAKATPPPAKVDWYTKAAPSIKRVYLNDTFGDCHSADTEVLTENGWTAWPDYDGSSLLATMNQQSGMMEFQAPIGLKRREHDGPMAFGTHKGQDFAVTPNHRFFHRPYHIPSPYVSGGAGYGALKFAAIADLPHRCMIPGATTGFLGTQIDKLTIGSRQWDGTDFLRLLALILSDGYVAGGETNRQRIGFCCFREDRLDMVQEFAHRLEIREEKSRHGVWVIGDHPLADWLRANVYVGDELRSPFKRIPDLVKVASQAQIEEFLRFFGDQSIVGDTGNRQFYTSSRHMADDLQELLLRIGKRASVVERGPRPGRFMNSGQWIESNNPSFTLHEWEDSDVSLLRAGKKASFVYDHYKGEVFCAEVPNSTLITRRNGSVLISGNCVIAGKYHHVGVWTANDTTQNPNPECVLGTDNEVLQSYHGICGAGDNGCNITSVLDTFKSRGLPFNGVNHKIDGYVAIDWTNQLAVKVGIYLFGGLTLGINLPGDWTCTNCVWDSSNSRIVGGHDICAIGFDEQYVYCATWGGIVQITWRAFTSRNWLEECYALLSPDWYGADKLSANGVNMTQLQADLAAFANGQIPDPGPGPSPTGVSIKDISPVTGPSGTSININGTRLTGVKVTFGQTPATSVTQLTDAAIQAVVPQLPNGPTDVTVTSPDGQTWATLTAGFMVAGSPPSCPPGTHWDATKQQCVPDIVPPPPSAGFVHIPDQVVTGTIFGQPWVTIKIPGGTYPVVQSAAMQAGITIPPWAIDVLRGLCTQVNTLPPPYSYLAQFLCSLLPAQGMAAAFIIPPWLIPVLGIVCSMPNLPPWAAMLCGFLPHKAKGHCGCCHGS